MGAEPLLAVDGLVTEFDTPQGVLRAVDGVSFELNPGGTLGVVGESGCGKSVMAMSIMGLLPVPPARVVAGEVRLSGQDLMRLREPAFRRLRGSRLAMVFQEPMSALNPVYTVGQQLVEPLRLHQGLSRRAARARAVELLAQVGIPAPHKRVDAYPHELSGGMRQRVMIAMAVSCDPEVLIADEPTTALDVTIQAQVLHLLSDLQAQLTMGIVLITHDLGVVAEFADQVLVMYAGRAVERASTFDLFSSPQHPYTKGLLGSIPGAHRDHADSRRRLPTIEGTVPDLRRLPRGCRFRSRCPEAIEVCAVEEPPLVQLTPSRQAACFVAEARARQDRPTTDGEVRR